MPPLFDGQSGATCSHFLAGIIPWIKRGGDWRDADGVTHGPRPFAVAEAGRRQTAWLLTDIVRIRALAGQRELALFLKGQGGSGYVRFNSRESQDPLARPMLALEFEGGVYKFINASADSQIDCSTAYSLGTKDSFVVSGGHSAVISFKLPVEAASTKLRRATLVLTPMPQASTTVGVGVFEVHVSQYMGGSPLTTGVASRFPADVGIERHPQVLFAEAFERADFLARGWMKQSHGDMEVVREDAARGFAPLQGGALRIRMRRGQHLGSDLRLYLRDVGGERDEVYMRYYLRFGDDWDPRTASGKLPGIAGTYDRAGWGGRPTAEADGWSLRGAFGQSVEPGHPFEGKALLGTYAYHLGMTGTYGDIWPWPHGQLERNRWYCIEQHVRLNQPGASDGLLRVWIDGRPSLVNEGLALRRVADTRIETIWFNVYYGGTEQAPRDMSLFIDNVVISKSYIGPMAR